MMNIMLAVVTATALVGGGALAVQAGRDAPQIVQASYLSDQAQLKPQRLVIAIDLSKSNPLIDNPDFAAKVAARIADEVRGLGFASEVHVRTFGNYDAGSNNFHYVAVLAPRNRLVEVANAIDMLLAGTPMLVRDDKWRVQGTTNTCNLMD